MLSYTGDKHAPQLSSRAAEVGFVLVRAGGARVHALYASQTDGRSRTCSREESVLKGMAELAERYDMRFATHISKRGGVAEAILKEARNGYGMIVMGEPAAWRSAVLRQYCRDGFRGWKNPSLLVGSRPLFYSVSGSASVLRNFIAHLLHFNRGNGRL